MNIELFMSLVGLLLMVGIAVSITSSDCGVISIRTAVMVVSLCGVLVKLTSSALFIDSVNVYRDLVGVTVLLGLCFIGLYVVMFMIQLKLVMKDD